MELNEKEKKQDSLKEIAVEGEEVEAASENGEKEEMSIEGENSSSYSLEVSFKQKLIFRICVGLSFIAFGLVLLLAGLGHFMSFNLMIGDMVALSILLLFFALFLSHAIIFKNVISTWISVMFFVPALVEILIAAGLMTMTEEGYTEISHIHLYPLYIAAIAIASLITAVIFGSWRTHAPFIVLFGALSILFSLQSTGLAYDAGGWTLIIPVAIGFVVLFLIYTVLSIVSDIRKKEESEEAEELIASGKVRIVEKDSDTETEAREV